MSERVSQTILLCEDDPQERLVRSYLKECGLPSDRPQFKPRNASREVHGGNVAWVLREFPIELQACRQRHAAHANTLLIVVADADDFQVVERRGHLKADPPLAATDPLVVLIPRRHIETWIRAALAQAVNETDNYKKPELEKAEFRAAAREIFIWARPNAQTGKTCVESLISALPEWRKIG